MSTAEGATMGVRRRPCGRDLWIVVTLLLAALAVPPGFPERAAAYMARGPIVIQGNAGFTTANGVTGGSGTPLDPYVIEGWEIDAASSDWGIRVLDTTAPFAIRGVHVYGTGSTTQAGIDMNNVTAGRIADSVVENTYHAVSAQDSRDVLIEHNNLSGNAMVGVWASGARVVIRENRIADNGQDGVILWAENSSIVGNTIARNGGIGVLLYTRNATILSNTFTSDGLFVTGVAREDFTTHTVGTDNLVNGKPLLFYRNCDGLDVDGVPAGQLIVAGCRDVWAAHLSLEDADVGIELAYVDRAVVTANVIANESSTTFYLGEGVYVYGSSNVTVTGNVFRGTGEAVAVYSSVDTAVSQNKIHGRGALGFGDGVHIAQSRRTYVADNLIEGGTRAIWVTLGSDATLAANTVASNLVWGILVQYTANVTATGNEVTANLIGVRLILAPRARVVGNALVNNTYQVMDYRSADSAWDDGYPRGGNYWSDYAGTDNCSGPAQDVCPDPDGIGDTPYGIDADSRDRYPLMAPPSVSQSGDTSPPVITSLRVAPTAPEVFTFATVQGTVRDDTAVARAWLEVRGPPPLRENVTLALRPDGSWTHVEAFPLLGDYEAVAWAVDAAGNLASRSLRYAVADTTPPVLTDASAAPAHPTAGDTVDLSVDATDNCEVARVDLELVAPGGASSGPFAMRLNASDGRYHYLAPLNASGVWRYVVTATDASSNANGTSGTLEVADAPSVPPPDPPPAVVVAVALGSAVVGGVFVFTEVGKVALLMLLAAPIYGRRRRGERDSETRGMVRGYILVHPGDTYTEVKRNLRLNNGSLAWHLKKLEREGLVKSRVEGVHRRYYPADAPFPKEEAELHAVQRRLLAAVARDPGIPVKILAQQVGVSSQLALYHIRKMAGGGQVVLERKGLQFQVSPGGRAPAIDAAAERPQVPGETADPGAKT